MHADERKQGEADERHGQPRFTSLVWGVPSTRLAGAHPASSPVSRPPRWAAMSIWEAELSPKRTL
jgi:hypothetical protein